MTDKELGLYLKENPIGLRDREFKETIKYIFTRRNDKFYKNLKDYKSLARRKIFMAFRPKSNVLEGYIPSSIVDRFLDDN